MGNTKPNGLAWLAVLGAGALPASLLIGAAPLTLTSGVLAALAFLAGAGGAAKTLHMEPRVQRPAGADNQIADDEEPRR